MPLTCFLATTDLAQPKRKRAQPRQGPYNSARDAIEGFAVEKKFSTRVNYDILRNLDSLENGEDLDGLERFEDEKDDEDDEKYDDEKEGA